MAEQNTSTGNTLSQQEEYAQLVQEIEALERQAIVINTQISAQQEQYAVIQQETRDKYGTDDVDELRNIYLKKSAENRNELKKMRDVRDGMNAELEAAKEALEKSKKLLNLN